MCTRIRACLDVHGRVGLLVRAVLTATAAVIEHGGALYTQLCSVCHGANGVQARSSFPNLATTPLLWTQEGFDQVVLQGGRADKGMGNFGKDLTADDAVAVRAYLIARANAVKAGAAAAGSPAPRTETGHAN